MLLKSQFVKAGLSMADRFLVTKELGRLCRWLRVLGYDAEYFEEDLKRIFLVAFNQGRTIVTKDSKVPDSKEVRIIRIKNNNLKEQIKELQNILKLKFEKNNIFIRCVECNLPVVEILKSRAKERVPPYVFKTQKSFSQCPKCKRLFWKATHFQNLKEFLRGVRS